MTPTAEAPAAPTSPAVGEECRRAFSDAASNAALGEAAAEGLEETVGACTTLAEWQAGAALFPGALGGVQASAYLDTRCAEPEPPALCAEVRR